MKKYNYTVIADKQTTPDTTKKSIRYTVQKKSERITLEDIKAVCDELNAGIAKEKEHNIKYIVTAQTITNQKFNIKAFAEYNIRYDSMDDYLRGRVRDSTKFEELHGFTITLFKTTQNNKLKKNLKKTFKNYLILLYNGKYTSISQKEKWSIPMLL